MKFKKKRMKWSVVHNYFIKTKNSLHLLPELCLWYDRDYFLETGIYSPAFGFQVCWLKWKWAVAFQKTY